MSGDVGRRVARIRGRVDVVTGLDVCFRRLVSGEFALFGDDSAMLLFRAEEDSGCSDFRCESILKLGIRSLLVSRNDGGLIFSLPVCGASSLGLISASGTCSNVSRTVGSERSEYILGLGVSFAAFSDFNDEDATLSGGDLDFRDERPL